MWEAANAPRQDEHNDESFGGVPEGGYSFPHSQGIHDPHANNQHPRFHPNHRQQGGRSRHRVASTETIEAALSRLSKAYTTSIECIGAIHKTNQMVAKEEGKLGNLETPSTTKKDAALEIIHKVSNVARTTLETAIFLDPLMLPHLPILHQTMIELSNTVKENDSNACSQENATEMELVNDASSNATTRASRWKAVKEQRPLPPTISSAAHKSTLVKLAYLSLVNYSDLLQQSSISSGKKKASILDRGIVSRLRCLDNSCSWSPEDSRVTQRLAVAALCDASNLDGSDPVMWLKLACASRRLENLVGESYSNEDALESRQKMTTVERLQHRKLQKHALERGSVALPKHMPPNRTILRAMEEFFREPEPEEYYSGEGSTTDATKVYKKTMELTRYSWSILGKMIHRACKGEEVVTTTSPSLESSSLVSSHSMRNSSELLFGSPTVVLQLSPMLVLPSKVLGKICQYLENTSIWKFEATCRALSVNIIAARASMEEYDDDDDEDDDAADLLLKQHEQRQKELLQKIQDKEKQKEPDRPNPSTNASGGEGASDQLVVNNGDDNSNIESTTGTVRPSQPASPPQRLSSRSSKRLRTQQITTGKKQDREAKRKSFDYCFVAATLSCTKEKHDKLAVGLRKKRDFCLLFRTNENTSLLSNTNGKQKSRYILQHDTSDNDSSNNTKYTEARERISDASLSVFVRKWSSNNSGPMDLLERYLAHVALFAEDVFASDSPAMGLHSCVLSLFNLLLLRSGSHQSIVPQFYQALEETGCVARSLETFAMDLLYAELILRQCDRYSPRVVEFDDDANLISLMMPALVRSCEQLEEEIHAKTQDNLIDQENFKKFCLLEARCYWLTASFFLWRSRISQAIYLSREAEDEGIHFIGMTMKCFDSSALERNKTVKTPHLVSPGRQDPYWREISPTLLSKFRDEIQASSVVSHARQQFQEFVSALKKGESSEEISTEISTDDAGVLAGIGRKLFERYNSKYGSADSKLTELVDNFLAVRGEGLLSKGKVPRKSEQDGEGHCDIHDFIQIEPYKVEDLRRVSSPTILSMLVISLNMDKTNRLSIAQLLLRLILTVRDTHSSLLKQIAGFRSSRKQTDPYHSDDAMSDSDDDSLDGKPRSSQKDDDEKKARQCGHFIKLLVDCLCTTLASYLSGEERKTLLTSEEFINMVESVLDFSNHWFKSTVSYLGIPSDILDQDVVRSIRKLSNEAKDIEDNGEVSKTIDSVFFRGLVRIMISQTEILKNLTTSQVNRSNRTARQRLCIQRAEYIGIVASELGAMLSTNLARVNNFVMRKGSLFEYGNTPYTGITTSKPLTSDEEILFLHAVRRLRDFASQGTGDGLGSNSNHANSFDRPARKELKIPLSILIIALCGSSSCSRKQSYLQGKTGGNGDGESESDALGLGEFFDTDTSINDWEYDSENEGNHERSKKELLRVICHAIHCIVVVFEAIDEKDVVTKFLEKFCDPEFGALLPLVAARVLNFFSDILLLNFGDDDTTGKDRKLLWLDEYPYHTKCIGELLDSSLHKTYCWLYGFALVGDQTHQSNTGNESVHSVSPINEIAARRFKLESTVAAGQLYRCITRAYASGRRTPPKQALEAVSAALPPHQESEQSRTLRRFVFAGQNDDLDIGSVFSMGEQWDSVFSVVRDSIKENKDSLDDSMNTSLDELEATRVRRGLSKQLALGPLPIVTSDYKTKSETIVDDDRSQTKRNEIAIAKKFNAILDDLCLSDADNWEGWYRAAQCCVMKADAIADRLGLTLGFSRVSNFSIPTHRGSNQRTLDISDLHQEQEYEEKMAKQKHFLGDDYSLYVNHAWSSFSSLRECVTKLKENCLNSESGHQEKIVDHAIWEEIDSMYNNGNYLEWQEACGGIFVSALRNLASRFMCVALYILQSKPKISSDIEVLLSDVCETLGNICYSELMASQKYGWPMRLLTSKRKRTIAEMAKACYQASIKHADDSIEEGENNEDHSTWDLQFMVGKCIEKIAGTYEQEAFPKQGGNSPEKTRLYEEHMRAAISVYSQALEEANKLEEAGTQLLDSGGSGHGSTEILYRLHASRLKCLIRAVSRKEQEREQAELEALRLTEKYSFKKPDPQVDEESKEIRERIWTVFADVVDGLSQCRKMKPFFHRSIFRHAQALMWSPVFYDPCSSKGSMGIVPATHSSQIKGLNGTKPAAFSAEEVINVLFDKKRTQLCAVWVTNSGAASPFQAMNSTIRKYDSLRGKYIGGYLEVLRLCNRRSETETFMKWLITSKRDQASYFQAGAMNAGEKPTIPQTQDPLLIFDNENILMSNGFLISIKRKANSVFADILMNEMSKKLPGTSSKPSVPSEPSKLSEFYLRHSYACYLRLNCSIQDLKRVRAWKYGSDSIHEVDALCQAFLSMGETVVENSGSDLGDWSGGARKSVIFKAALSKCEKLFPSLSAYGVFGKSKAKKVKNSSAAGDGEEQGKRKSLSSDEETEKVSFEVAVPSGLTSGDTFLTSVKVGASDPIRIKLTVPDGEHSTLRFSLKVPKSKSPSQESNKKAKLSS